jgi:hypothetical protein
MTYNKPEVVTLESPIRAIQGILGKPFNSNLDATTDPHNPNYGVRNATPAAYEADE